MLVCWILGGVVALIVIHLVYEPWRYQRHAHFSFYCVSRITAEGELIRHRRAVFSLIPARMAAVESGVPVPSSIVSLLTCRSVTIRPPLVERIAHRTGA